MPPNGAGRTNRTALLEKAKPARAKDDEEARLEKLVFGDDEGFHNALTTYDSDNFEDAVSSPDEEASELEAETNEELDAVADDDLFYIDTGIPTNLPKDALILAQEDPDEDPNDVPAWIDSEDEKIVVSLASDTRLRKLRIAETDDLVNGKEYIRRLQQQFERLYPRPEWAIQAESGHHKRKRRRLSAVGSSADEYDSDDSLDVDEIGTQPLAKLLQSTNALTADPALPFGKRNLRAGILDIQRGKDIGDAQPSAVTSLSFHPSKPILLSSGPSGLVTLHHLSAASQPPNQTIHTLSVPRHPIHTAAIHPSGDSIYFSSRRKYFLTWSLTTGKVTRSSRFLGPMHKTTADSNRMSDQQSCERFRLSPCGRYMALTGTSKKVGVVNILDTNTAQWICQARVEGRNGVADIVWWRNSEGLVILSKGSDVIEYSIAARKVIARWRDEGLIAPTTLALGGKTSTPTALGGDTWLAIGLQSGIITIYQRSAWTSDNGDINVPSNPQPIKTFSNLTTSISHLEFSTDGQMLLFFSRWKRDALRLVHVPSWSVYARWPTSGTPLGRVSAAALSSSGNLLVVANEAGKIRAWDIRG